MSKEKGVFCKRTMIALISFVLFAGILLCLKIGKMNAYLMDEKKLVNTVTIGKNVIVIDEAFEKPVKEKKTVKEPCIKNTGTVDCFVRAKVVVTDSRSEEYLNYYYGEQEGWNEKEWTVYEDGWIYYKDILKVGECTRPIFSHVKISADLPDAFADFSVDVLAESVQAEHFTDAKEAFMAIGVGGDNRGIAK